MAEAKTQITDVDPADFIAEVEPEAKREDAKVLDALFRKVTGEAPQMWGPSIIGYGQYRTTYASGRDVHWMRAGFSPRKANSTIYIMPGYQDLSEMLTRLGKHKTGRSCLYVNKLSDIDLEVLKEIITFGLNDMRSRYTTYER